MAMAVVCTTDVTGRAQSAYEPNSNSWHWSSDTYNGPYAEYSEGRCSPVGRANALTIFYSYTK